MLSNGDYQGCWCHLHVQYCLQKVPPVRSQATVKATATSNGGVRKRKKKKKTKLEGTKKDSSKPRIKSFDYRAWDEFNVVSRRLDYLCIHN